MSTIQLLPEQRIALDGPEPVRAVDPTTNKAYILVREDIYLRLQPLLDDNLPDTAALMNEVLADDDANDPLLASYQHYKDAG